MSSAGTPYRLVPVRPTFTSGRADAMTGRRVDAVPHRPYVYVFCTACLPYFTVLP